MRSGMCVTTTMMKIVCETSISKGHAVPKAALHMLYSEDECPSEKPNGWKDVCAAVLTQKVTHVYIYYVYYNNYCRCKYTHLTCLVHTEIRSSFKRTLLINVMFTIYLYKQQLDDGLIYYLASLPCNTFRAITTIFQKFSKGLLKGQKVP